MSTVEFSSEPLFAGPLYGVPVAFEVFAHEDDELPVICVSRVGKPTLTKHGWELGYRLTPFGWVGPAQVVHRAVIPPRMIEFEVQRRLSNAGSEPDAVIADEVSDTPECQ